MDMNKDFKKFANSEGITSTLLDSYTSYMNSHGPEGMTPYIIEESELRGVQLDVFSRLMKDRTIFLGTGINEQVANIVIAQLLYLNSVDSKKDIKLYVGSPGGSVYAGYGIIDTMHFISNDVSTINVYLAASMGAMILSEGAKGKRYALPRSRTMIHQPLGGAQGQASDIEINAKQILLIKDELYDMLSKSTGQSVEQITKDADRDCWFKAEEAKAYGLVDEVIKPS